MKPGKSGNVLEVPTTWFNARAGFALKDIRDRLHDAYEPSATVRES
jgi:hypothetical protein